MHGRNGHRGGAMVMIVAQLCVVLIMFMLASLFIGRWSNQKDEHQNQSDAISIAAMQIARTEGMEAVCAHPAMQALLLANSNAPSNLEDCGAFVEQVNPDGTTSLRFVAGVTGQMDTDNNQLLPLPEPFTVRTRGTASVDQQTFDEAERRLPKFVLVLDYSGSMGASMGGGRSRLDVLVSATTGLMNLDLDIEYGVVMYDSDVFRTVNIAENNDAAILQAINSSGPRASTNYQAALDRTRQLFNGQDNTGFYVLFMSDGAPTAGGDPLDAADRVRNNDITIFTLNIGGGGAQRDLLKDMGGTMEPAEYGNERYYFSASNEQEMLDTFQAIVANILCAVGPLDNFADIDPDNVFVLLQNEDGTETPLVLRPNLGAARGELAYNFNPADGKIRLTETACDRVLEEGDDIVVRYGALNLVSNR